MQKRKGKQKRDDVSFCKETCLGIRKDAWIMENPLSKFRILYQSFLGCDFIVIINFGIMCFVS